MVYKLFILLVVGVCFLEVKSSPRRGFEAFGGFQFDAEGDGDEDQDNKKDDKVGDNSEGQRRLHHHRHGPGFNFEGGLPFGNPAAIIPSVHAIRENFQKLPALPHQVLLGKNGLLQNFLPSGGDRSNAGSKTSTSTSTSTSTTTTSKSEDKKAEPENPEKPSTEKAFKPLPKDFTFLIPTENSKKPTDKSEDSGKSSTTSTENPKDEKEPAGPGGLNRRLINAPLRCQEDGAGNCREAF